MAKITIIGGGQSGLQLGIGLRQNGYDVTVVSDRTPEQIHDGRVMSSQCMFATALDHERELGIDFWDDTCPPVEGIALAVPHPEIAGAKAIDWAARLDRVAMSVDQRLKFPRWMEHFASIGGELVIEEAVVDDLERYAETSDLVVVAAGKGDITRLFERDAERSQFEQPMRALALTYVTGMTPASRVLGGVLQPRPGRGGVLRLPGPDDERAVRDHGLRGRPGRPDGLLGRRLDPGRAPREVEVDPRDVHALGGRALPTRSSSPTTTGSSPVGSRRRSASRSAGCRRGGPCSAWPTLSILNDPITGQGSNNAAKGAAVYLQSILERGEGPFDEAWMQETFERLWVYAEKVVGWTNALLLPPPPHVLEVLGAAGQFPAVAHRFANGFDNPPEYYEWFMDPDSAGTYLAEVAAS